MALEVRELVIRASVSQPPGETVSALALAEALKRLERELVQTCLARVMDELAQREQR
ncbi:DUF5908 family protein [Massilia sp. TS11]|uniref:DUF5908 family protein n=1 Tax=Massilia sp. TS11 TaxID=2908003 RepID=UPI001EDA2D3A|nr:DUF5908 family protein [Massilia sp. TS11]MCG2584161.1 DUF5908 family protein [Massilia sp. TS11]